MSQARCLPMTERQKILLVYGLSFVCLLLWLGAIFLAPFLKSSSRTWGDFIYTVFSPVCHQIAERSFFFFGNPLAVCTRCLGIYSGCLSGMLLYPPIRGFVDTASPKIWLFVLLTIPIAVDTGGIFFSVWKTTPWLRFTIGFIWGVILPFYFISGLSDAWIKMKKKNSLDIREKIK